MEHPALATLENRIRYWLDTLAPMGCAHWAVDVEITDAPDGNPDSNAACSFSTLYDTAKIEFNSSHIDEANDREIDCTIVHELLHLVGRDLWSVHKDSEVFFGKPAWTMQDNRFHHELEGFTDRVARALVEAHACPWSSVVRCADDNQGDHVVHARHDFGTEGAEVH